MRVHLFDVFNVTVEKNWRLKKCTSFEEQKGTRYIWGKVYFGIIVFTCLSSTKPCLRFLLICFCSWDKKLLVEFLRKWGLFQGYNERFPKYLDWKLKFQKPETRFCRWKSTDNNHILVSSCHWKTVVTFCLRKERTEKAFLTLIVSYCKIVQKNKLCHPKQQ